MTDPLGRSQVLPYLVGLSRHGIRFHLISFEKQETFEKHRQAVEGIVSKAGIQWHPISYTKKPPILSTIWDIYRMERLASQLIHKHGINAIHCRSYISGLVGMKLKRKYGLPFIFDIRGFWADERVEGGLWDLNQPVYKTVYAYFKKQEQKMFDIADRIVSLTNRAAKIIAEKHHATIEKIHVIPCCADLDHFNAKDTDRNQALNIQEKTGMGNHQPVLGYLGAIGTWYMLDEMFEFFKRLLVRYPNAYFLLITTEKPESIFQAARKIGVPTQHVGVYAASREEVPAAISLFDVSLFFIRPTYSKTASSPTKQGELMGMGIPIICNKGIGDTDHVINTYHCGDCIELNDPSAMDQAVAAFEQTMRIPKDRIRKGAEEFYALDAGVAKYLSLYQSLGMV
jgi:glycosyltransferase involved in cell wall biosynthesis